MNKPISQPFVKWAGGKRQLIETIDEHLPDFVREGDFTYIEPFIGGGALFFHLLNKYKVSDSVIIDKNNDLILLYRTIKARVEDLILELERIQEEYYPLSESKRKEYYYSKRDIFNNEIASIDYGKMTETWVSHAAHFIFLNRTCFNGLYRVNKSGEFNVPIGSYKKPRICDKENLLSVSSTLTDTKILSGDFEEALEYIKEKTFIYFDPPYRPLSSSASFTAYSKSGFNDDEQIRLAKFFRKLNDNPQVRLMLSNSDPKNADENDNFFDNLYKGFNILRVSANRNINSKKSGRGEISELLILNYETKNEQLSLW